jgi:NAD(P)-dependent dehydrogenase (short-subunit alcohol dehydrogenase family)
MSKIWLVTGSSRGLGREVVIAALDAGDSVVATARKPEQLSDLVRKYGNRVLPLAMDVSDANAVNASVARATETFGRIDVVVNNAGYANMAAVEDISLDDFRAQIDTNFLGVVLVTKAVVPILRKQGSGHIFQISSVGGRIGSPGLSAYQSAKFAVRGFSLVLAQEVAPLGIQVTVVEPGGLRTDWAGSSMQTPPISEPYQPTVGRFVEMLRAHSGKEASDPAKVAEVLVQLAGRKDAPVELLMGADAYEYATHAANAVAESDRKWRDLTVSVTG